MTTEDFIKQQIEQICAKGSITPQEQNALLQQATAANISKEQLNSWIENELNKRNQKDDFTSSGFLTEDKNKQEEPDNTSSGFLTEEPENNISSGFLTEENNNTSNFNQQTTQNQSVKNSLFADLTPVGEGGMGAVFKARLNNPNDRYHGRWIVLKRIKPEFENNTAHRELFFKEYQITIELDNANIIRALGKGKDTQGSYYFMEFVDGKPLENFISAQGVNDKMFVRKVLTQILGALSYMHKHQVFHRDLKPENVLITFKGNNAKIIDFGLASTDSFSDNLSSVGTPKYAAPEQKTKGTTVDGRADIYSLGLMLLEMLTGSASPQDVAHVENPLYYYLIKKSIKENPNERFFDCDQILNLFSMQESQLSSLAASELKIEADQKFAANQFVQAAADYQKCLKWQPNNQEIQQRLNECNNSQKTTNNTNTNQRTNNNQNTDNTGNGGGSKKMLFIILFVVIGGLITAGIIFKDEIFGGNEDIVNPVKDTTENNVKPPVTAKTPNKDKADKFFKDKNIVNALDFYHKALNNKETPKDYIEKQISECETIIKLAKNLKAVISNTKYGFEDESGYTIIDYKFDNARDFSEGLGAVQEDGKWGYIDRNGEPAIGGFKYADAKQFSEGLAGVKDPKKKLWGFINKKGELKIGYRFTGVIQNFRRGVAKIKSNAGTTMKVNKKGQMMRK